MANGGEVLYLFNGGHLDLRNTSPERPVEVEDKLGKKLLLKDIVMEVIEKPKEEIIDEIVDEVFDEIETEEISEHQEEEVVKEWAEMGWHEKKKFADANEYKGNNYKEDTLDNWYKGFLKLNEV